MNLCRLIIAATLVGFVSTVVPVMTIQKVEAAVQTVKKNKKKVVRKQSQKPVVKKNFRGPRPGEPSAGWTDDCLFYYDVYGRLPAYCEPFGHGFRTFDW